MLRLVRASFEDAEDIGRWRNDARTRSMSISTAFVEKNAHERWFRNALSDARRTLFIGLAADDSTKIGMCRFDLDADGSAAEVSINLNPVMRGKGWAKSLLRESAARYLLEHAVCLKATVRRQNAAAIRCFLDCGFHLRAEDSEYFFFRLDPRRSTAEVTDSPCR